MKGRIAQLRDLPLMGAAMSVSCNLKNQRLSLGHPVSTTCKDVKSKINFK